MRIVKGESSEWINKENLCPAIFRWQEGYAAFSYSRSQIKVISEYIENQEVIWHPHIIISSILLWHKAARLYIAH
ncbi:transposase [Mucilaginibacter sp.]|jgi:hypothetical protein|uniref:transposase n=1 Tax=Mucilaginibacter sp. TaxID=1882438 RepID=UPI00356559EE